MTFLRFPLLAAFVSLAVLLAGCGGARSNNINVTVADIRPANATLLESSAILTLRYTSESIAPLGFSGSSHKLYLNGRYVGQAVSNEAFGLPPLTSITREVTVHLENLSLLRQLLDVRDTATAAYRLDSVLFQTLYEDKVELKSRSEGSLDLRSFSSAVR